MMDTLHGVHTENDSLGQRRHPVSAAPGEDSDRRQVPGWPAVIAAFIVLGALAIAVTMVPLWLYSAP